MDWPLAVERNRKALELIVKALFALAGLAHGGTAATLPRSVYRSILCVLRPAESALRRLIIILAHGLIVTPRITRPFPGLIAKTAGQEHAPAFCLIDPLKRFSASFVPAEEGWDNDIWAENEDDAESGHADFSTLPRVSVPGYFDPVLLVPAAPTQNDAINAKYIVMRLFALRRALENLPREARRLARWQARRDLALTQAQPKPHRLSPFRPGRAPGFRARAIHEVDNVLSECHALALDRLAAPNSS